MTNIKVEKAVQAAVAPRVTSRSIAMNIILANLPLRVQYHGKKAFSIEKQADKRCETNPEKGMFNSYTDFRQVTRDMIIKATGCSAASARTMFIYAKDRLVEQCKADGHFAIQIDGKEVKLTLEQLSMKRDLKPKVVKEKKVEVKAETKVADKATPAKKADAKKTVNK